MALTVLILSSIPLHPTSAEASEVGAAAFGGRHHRCTMELRPPDRRHSDDGMERLPALRSLGVGWEFRWDSRSSVSLRYRQHWPIYRVFILRRLVLDYIVEWLFY